MFSFCRLDNVVTLIFSIDYIFFYIYPYTIVLYYMLEIILFNIFINVTVGRVDFTSQIYSIWN